MGTPRTSSLVSIQVNNFSLPNYDDVILEHLFQGQKATSCNLISMIYYVTLSHLFNLCESKFLHKGNNNLPFRVDFMVINLYKINPLLAYFQESLETCTVAMEKRLG